MSQALPSKWVEALSLSRRRAPEFYQTGAAIEPGPHAEAIQLALTELGLSGVFCIEGVPTIGFLNEPNATIERIDTLHRILWNQGLMSLLLVIGDDEMTAYSLVRRPFRREQSTTQAPQSAARDPRLIETLSLLTDALRLRELVDSTESGRFWYEHDDYFDPAQRVDRILLENLLQAHREIKDDLGNEAAQALLMQTMFIAYLEDREIVKPEVFRETSDGEFSTFEEFLKAKSNVPFNQLFAWLKKAFNGNVFNAPCAFEFGEVKPAR